MYNAELISVLNQYKVRHQAKYGIKRLGRFGSTARGAATDQSDLDIVVELEKQDLFFMIGIKAGPGRTAGIQGGHNQLRADNESLPETPDRPRGRLCMTRNWR